MFSLRLGNAGVLIDRSGPSLEETNDYPERLGVGACLLGVKGYNVGMGNLTQKPKAKIGRPRLYDRDVVSDHIIAELAKGRSLLNICTTDPGVPDTGTFLQWVHEDDPAGLSVRYAHARDLGYRRMGDEILELSNKKGEWVDVQDLDVDGRPLLDEDGKPILKKVYMPLNSDVIAHTRLQIDTRKWLLAKMLPKVYGEKVTNEHTGKDGGPIQMAAVDFKNLSDEELDKMQQLLSKAEVKNASGTE